jgi:hypothetical protein
MRAGPSESACRSGFQPPSAALFKRQGRERGRKGPGICGSGKTQEEDREGTTVEVSKRVLDDVQNHSRVTTVRAPDNLTVFQRVMGWRQTVFLTQRRALVGRTSLKLLCTVRKVVLIRWRCPLCEDDMFSILRDNVLRILHADAYLWNSPECAFSSRLELLDMKNPLIYALFVILIPCPLLQAQENPPRLGSNPVPRIEIGPVISSANQDTLGNYYHVGGGGRVTLNFNRFVGMEAESTRQPTGDSSVGPETHTSFAAKGTYRKEQARWLKFAGLNFFGVAGLGFLNRSVAIAPNPPLKCICTASQRQTKAIFDFGGGFEVVPARLVSIRFDVTRADFQEMPPYFSSPFDRRRVFIKTAIMLRFK